VTNIKWRYVIKAERLGLYHKEHNYFYSLLADGPIEYEMTETTAKPTLITKYGKRI